MKKKSFYIVCASIILFFSCILISCAQTYSTSITADDLLNCSLTAMPGMDTDSMYKMTSAYVTSFMGIDVSNVTFSVNHTLSSASYDELGVFKCSTNTQAKALLEKINLYLETSKQENVPVAKGYAPSEVPKLENARAEQYGVYVVYAILDSALSDAWFASVQSILAE